MVAIVGAVGYVAIGGRSAAFAGGQHITRVNVSGVISANRQLIQAVTALAKDRNVAAVVLAVDSPGGSVSGGESLHDALEQVAAAKPVVTVMGGTAASAGYMISLPAARIFASNATLTGSIGVILETGNAGGLLDKLGLTAEAIISGPLKDQPSFTHGLSPAGREYLQALVGDMFGQFVTMVAQARHMDEAKVRELADGRAYTGRQALALGLVDQIGGEPDARAWLEKEKGIKADLPIADLKLGSFYDRTVGATLGLISQRLGLDSSVGLPMAIWDPLLVR
ncbi:signal peptide peptidase SppA [Acidisphaera sp. L21]|uniref:signal peptide peptidase SppA n=1 Tax=Acidisphaera sp. L21 TaxID=1641851 RepID=UPI0020B114B7|nr:signal peptide peptidase SppA [Acidisphaera sp. L21]